MLLLYTCVYSNIYTRDRNATYLYFDPAIMHEIIIFQRAFNHIVYKALLLLAVYHWSPGLASRGLKLHYTVLRGGRKAVSRLMKA